MKLVQVVGRDQMLALRRRVRRRCETDDKSGEFERRMKEDPDFALMHQDDLRALKLLKPNGR